MYAGKQTGTQTHCRLGCEKASFPWSSREYGHLVASGRAIYSRRPKETSTRDSLWRRVEGSFELEDRDIAPAVYCCHDSGRGPDCRLGVGIAARTRGRSVRGSDPQYRRGRVGAPRRRRRNDCGSAIARQAAIVIDRLERVWSPRGLLRLECAGRASRVIADRIQRAVSRAAPSRCLRRIDVHACRLVAHRCHGRVLRRPPHGRRTAHGRPRDGV